MYHFRWRAAADPLLVLSGGRTQPQRSCAESRSYVELAQALDLTLSPEPVLEEYALTSIENLLFSLYAYHHTRQIYPAHIDVISWAFKRLRFEQTLEA